jgi:hypothetical protein
MTIFGKPGKWLTIVFVSLEAVLVILAYTKVFPAHYLAPFSIGALIAYVALMVVVAVWKRGGKHDHP